jgi:hypothetical protein
MDETTIDAIQRIMGELDDTRREMKVVKEAIKDVLLQNEEYGGLQEELKELNTKRGELKKTLQEDKDYQERASELDELKYKQKDLQEIMSHHLVTYYNETKATQIKGQDGEVRQIILSAKIGKPEALFDES